MSYILDALKKSDKQRQQARVPDLNTAPQELAQPKKKKASWAIPLAAIVLGNVIFILFFIIRQNQPATETQAIVPSSDQAQQETVQQRRKAIAPQATPALSPASREPRQAETAAPEDESTVASMTEDAAASRQDPAAAAPMSPGETAAGPQPQADAQADDNGESGENGPEEANMAPQATPALSPAGRESRQAETAAPEDERTAASMAEDDAASRQDPAAAAPMSAGETAAEPPPQEDAFAEDNGESGSEEANTIAALEEDAIASPATATPPEEYDEKPQQDESQRPGPGETADPSPIGPETGLMKKALHIDQLPAAIRRQLPDIHISAHLFYENKPTSRLASINGKVLREGQMLAPDLKVAEIATDGVIFRYRKYLFYVPVF
jgi:hypothetical protein